ncbi:hypothetical protein COO60DRAFT_1643865 [Scenedesmus sp. NREL 46B-D3]|nr:hypothetical protein COO60DRAFT_1643865 [Scenedesmus sp. NREL 46B-D3]
MASHAQVLPPSKRAKGSGCSVSKALKLNKASETAAARCSVTLACLATGGSSSSSMLQASLCQVAPQFIESKQQFQCGACQAFLARQHLQFHQCNAVHLWPGAQMVAEGLCMGGRCVLCHARVGGGQRLHKCHSSLLHTVLLDFSAVYAEAPLPRAVTQQLRTWHGAVASAFHHPVSGDLQHFHGIVTHSSLGADIGMGLFTVRELHSAGVVLPYTGVPLTGSGGGGGGAAQQQHLSSMATEWRGSVYSVDAGPSGGAAYFVNQAHGKQCNLESVAYGGSPRPMTWLQQLSPARKAIPAGAELFYDYLCVRQPGDDDDDWPCRCTGLGAAAPHMFCRDAAHGGVVFTKQRRSARTRPSS